MKKRTLSTLILSAAIATTAITMPIQAAVVDQVKNKVDAIKAETSVIKSKTSDIQSRVQEVAFTANAQIAETVDIRELLEPLMILKEMKEKLGGGGFDPAELLETIDTEELRAKLDEMKANKEELQQMVNDPSLEDFRQEYLDMLQGLNVIFAGNSPIEISPIQTLIEKAPLPLIGALKAASETSFGPLREAVVGAVDSLTEMKTLGLLGIADSSTNTTETNLVHASFTDASYFDYSNDEICVAIQNHGINKIYSVLWKYHDKLLKIKRGKGKVNKKAMKILRKIPKFPDLGIHGYLTIKLSGVDLAKHYSSLSAEQKSALQDAIDSNNHRLRKVEWKQRVPVESCGLSNVVDQGKPKNEQAITVSRSL